MFNVSEAYMEALDRPAKVRRIRGTIGTTSVTEANFLDGTLQIVQACAGGDEVEIGSVYMGTLNATVVGVDYLGSWYGKVVTLREGLLLADGETWEEVPLGVFRVISANHTAAGVAIEAYDDMRRLDIKKWPYTETYTGYPWDYLQEICRISHVELAQTEEEIRAFPNGDRAFPLWPENDIETCRDMLHWLTQTMACFATFNRAGKLELRKYGDYENPVDLVGSNVRWRGASISDFVTRYTAVSVEDINHGEIAMCGMPEDDALTYEMGANPLMQYNYAAEPVVGPLWPVLDALQAIQFTPFRIDRAACSAYDLGDVIRMEDANGLLWNPVGCIMQIQYTFHGTYTMSGFGSNPAMANVKTPADKEVAGAMSRMKSNEIQYYTFTNSKDILLDETDYKTVIDIRFGSMKDTLVVFQAELHMDVDTLNDKVTAYVQYIYDDEEMLYHPADTFLEGENLLHLIYYYRVAGGEVNRLKVNIKMDGGVAEIEKGNIQACVWGQGLAASDKWDGHIDCADYIDEVDLGTTPSAVDEILEDLDVDLIPVIRINASDTVEDIDFETTPNEVDEILEELYINKEKLRTLTWDEVRQKTWETLREDYGW